MSAKIAFLPETVEDLTRRADGAAVIRQEAEALALLAEGLDVAFDLAVRQILGTSGRLIVSGMGKAGHVGRKVAATLAATGSPAFFVHPSEAAHGDLGMVQPCDVLLVLSNSGATPELLPIVRHMVAIGAPVILITAKGTSPLAKYAGVVLLLPPVEEACPEGIAPTTSSTMMLALGDALAIAAMRARGFSRGDVMQLHPGGSIGWRAQPVDRLFRRDFSLPLVEDDTPLRDVILKMTATGKGIAGVVDQAGALIGVITDGDLRRGFETMLSTPARDIMTRNPKTLPGGATIGDAAALMAEARITVVFVMSREAPEKPVGVIHVHDLAMIG